METEGGCELRTTSNNSQRCVFCYFGQQVPCTSSYNCTGQSLSQKSLFVALSEAMYVWDECDMRSLEEALRENVDMSSHDFSLFCYFCRRYFLKRVKRHCLPPSKLYWRVRADLLAQRRHHSVIEASKKNRLDYPNIEHYDTWYIDAYQERVLEKHNVLVDEFWVHFVHPLSIQWILGAPKKCTSTYSTNK